VPAEAMSDGHDKIRRSLAAWQGSAEGGSSPRQCRGQAKPVRFTWEVRHGPALTRRRVVSSLGVDFKSRPSGRLYFDFRGTCCRVARAHIGDQVLGPNGGCDLREACAHPLRRELGFKGAPVASVYVGRTLLVGSRGRWILSR